MAGLSFLTNDLNNLAGGCARDLDSLMSRIGHLLTFLNRLGGGTITTPANATAAIAALVAAPWSMASADATALVTAYVDLAQFRAIYAGTVALAVAKDFTANSSALYQIAL